MSPRSAGRLAAWGLAAAASAAVLLLGTLGLPPAATPPQLDELTLVGAGARVAAGELPHRDVHLFVPTLVTLWHALLHAAFGPSLLAVRAAAWAAWCLAWTASAAVLVRRARRAGGDGLVPVLACAGAAAAWAWWPHSYAHWWGGIALAVLMLADSALQSDPGGRAASIAWCASLAALPLLDQPSALVGLLAAAVSSAGRFRRGAAGERARVAAVALTAAAAAVVLASTGLLGPLLRDVVLFPLTAYRTEGSSNEAASFASDLARRLQAHAEPAAVAGAWALPLALAASIAGAVAAPPGPAGRLTRAVAAGVVLVLVAGKHDLVHVAFVLPPALLAAALAAMAACSGAGPGRARRLARVAAPAASVLALVALAQPLAERPAALHRGWIAEDASWGSQPIVEEARAAAAANGGRLAVLGRGGRFAFHGVRTPLPFVDLLPRSSRYGRDEDRDEAARILAEAAPRWILLYPGRDALPFLHDDDALGDLLRSEYRSARSVEDGVMLVRERAADGGASPHGSSR